MDPTTQMPATGPGAGDGVPPVPPADADPTADDKASSTSSLLILETTDETGSAIDVGFIVSVVGPAESPMSFEWLRPDGVAPGEAAGANTGTDGRVDFEWQADESVAEPEAWRSTVSAVVNVPPGWVPFGPVIDCVLAPLEGPETTVALNIELDSPDSSIDRVAALTFPNHTFTPGDTVTCRLAASAPPADAGVPWYKKPGPIALMVIVGLAILGLLAWLIWGGDDDEASSTSSLLILETTDETGSEIDVGFIVSVVGPAESPTSFEWLRPDGVPPGEAAGADTGTDGRVDFEWQADESVEEPEAWLSTVSAVVNVPPGWVPFGPVIDCVRDPLEGQQSSVTMNIELDSPDSSIDRVGALTFPNYTFTPGDTVTCRLAASAPPPTTSTVVETTTPATTTPETTTPETTTAPTTAAPTTAPPATTTAPTVPPTIPPPTVGQTAWDVIEANEQLSGLEAAVLAADPSVQALLADPTATITLFAPSNEAIAAAGTPADVTALLLAHVDNTQVLLAADVLALPSVPVMEGGPQPVDAGAGTIGGAMVVQADIVAENGVIHLIDAVLPIQP